ncbi:MAG: hypothetical protein MI794_20085 [Pseudomonadales bacterium]|nr:hypothetical protein [Pseudomonadales bacterium]
MTTTTAESMNQPASQTPQHPTPAQVRRGRRMALLLFTVGFGPMILATVMFYTGWLNPTGHSNQGVLVQPVVPVDQLQLRGVGGEPLAERFGLSETEGQWLLLVVAEDCDGACEQLLYLARQVPVALGKNANRVARAAYVGQIGAELSATWEQQYRAMERLSLAPDSRPQWPEGVRPGQAPAVLLVDPLGNVLMRYDERHSGKDMLKDIKHLLKLSQIG